MRLDEINIHEKELCVKLVIYKNYTEMHGQQNIKNDLRVLLTHCGRVTQICVFYTVKLGTSASSP